MPVSVCCHPGTQKANRKGEPLWCFDCIQCAKGDIIKTSNKTRKLIMIFLCKKTEARFCYLNFSICLLFSFPVPFFLHPGPFHCEHCLSEFWSSVEQTTCIPRQFDFLYFNETWVFTLTTPAVSGAVVTAVFGVFLYYHQTLL